MLVGEEPPEAPPVVLVMAPLPLFGPLDEPLLLLLVAPLPVALPVLDGLRQALTAAAMTAGTSGRVSERSSRMAGILHDVDGNTHGVALLEPIPAKAESGSRYWRDGYSISVRSATRADGFFIRTSRAALQCRQRKSAPAQSSR